MLREEFFDLMIATVGPGEPARPMPTWRQLEPSRREIDARAAGRVVLHRYVTYVLRAESLDAYIQESFRSGTRNKPRLLRDVPARTGWTSGRAVEVPRPLRRRIVARPRGRDRVRA
jgi:hypothetical protein